MKVESAKSSWEAFWIKWSVRVLLWPHPLRMSRLWNWGASSCSTPVPALAMNICSCFAPLNPPSQLSDDLNLACEAPRCPAPGGVSSVESSPWQLIFLCLFLGFIAGTCLRGWCGVWLLQLCLILLDVFYFPLSLLEVLLPTVQGLGRKEWVMNHGSEMRRKILSLEWTSGVFNVSSNRNSYTAMHGVGEMWKISLVSLCM